MSTQLMAGLREQALRRVQGLGLVPQDLGSWDGLLACVARLPSDVLAGDLPDCPYRAFQLPNLLCGLPHGAPVPQDAAGAPQQHWHTTAGSISGVLLATRSTSAAGPRWPDLAE